jgi:pSer/pThr/pTyr-binding forkhead associated (FHA) protein
MSAQHEEPHVVTAHVKDTTLTITLDPGQEVILGRLRSPVPEINTVDLTAFDALAHGVAPLHAGLYVEDGVVHVVDGGSAEGTFLNGRRVPTSDWIIVRNGDQLRLGSLVMTLQFDENPISH